MEITERQLGRLVRETDAAHRDGMRSMAGDLAEWQAEVRTGTGHPGPIARDATSRRRVLIAMGAGGALTIGSAVLPLRQLLSPVWAQALDDKAIAKFAESVELAAVAAYNAASASGKLTVPAVAAAAITFAGHHADHAKAFGGFAGDTATAKANPAVLAAVSGEIKAAPDMNHVLGVAADLENAAASTYLFALGVLQAPAALKATASILPVESQHAVVLGTVIGTDIKTMIPSFQTADAKIDPAKFPAS
jgi:hypothetical protein